MNQKDVLQLFKAGEITADQFVQLENARIAQEQKAAKPADAAPAAAPAGIPVNCYADLFV